MKLDVIVAEIGSTTTVVSGFANLETDPCFVGQGQGPTTVEQGDVRQGLKQALAALQNNLGAEELSWDTIYACSSAAGGLKMTVHGLVYDMTARAAREAALGAGAVLHQVTAGPLSESDLEQIRTIMPNIILLAGGVDYGEREIILDNARKLAALNLPIPLIYAGNVAITEDIRKIFGGSEFDLVLVENVYPRIDELNVEPTRQAIQAAFEKHIVHAPGMGQIRELVQGSIQPVPGAVLNAAITLYRELGDLMVFDVGGATTDLHSVTPGSDEYNAIALSPEPLAKRTVEGDLGVYVNASNLINLLGQENLHALTGVADPEAAVVPIPTSPEQIAVAEALTGGAVKAALERHAGRISYIYGPGGRHRIVRGKDLTKVKYVIGTGGALTRLPRGKQLLAEGLKIRDPQLLKPDAETRVLLDRDYIMATVGVLAKNHPRAAVQLLMKSLAIDGKGEAE
ncbi:MAG: DNA mismatch repair protein MutL [Firmicutes bacterium]|nr:DNA mismatch repair protein MutL [Bacillota bacterium]